MAQTKKEVIETKGFPNPNFKYLISTNEEEEGGQITKEPTTFTVYDIGKGSSIDIDITNYIKKPQWLWYVLGYEHIAIYDGGIMPGQIERDPYLQQNVYIFSLKNGELVKEIKEVKRSYKQYYVPIFVGNSYFATFLPQGQGGKYKDKEDKNLYVYSLPDFKLINQVKISDDVKEIITFRVKNYALPLYSMPAHTIDDKEIISEYNDKYKAVNTFTGKVRNLSLDEYRKELQPILNAKNKTQYTPSYDIGYYHTYSLKSFTSQPGRVIEGHINLRKNGNKRLVIEGNVEYAQIDEQEEWLFVEMSGKNLLIKLKYIREHQDWLCLSGDCEVGQGRAIGIKSHNAGVRLRVSFMKENPQNDTLYKFFFRIFVIQFLNNEKL